MTDVPIRNPSGAIDCPRCGTAFIIGTAPFYLNGEYVGAFEALVCRMCRYSLFTSTGYDQAMLEASKYGLVGPPEEIISETIEALEQELVYQEISVSSNADRLKQVLLRPNEERVEDSSMSNVAEMKRSRYPQKKERYDVKMTQVFIH
jgi:hypothetical protein